MRNQQTTYFSGNGLAPFMNDVQLARYLGISVATIRRWRLQRNTAAAPYRRFGSSIRYSKAEVDEWVKRQPGGGQVETAA